MSPPGEEKTNKISNENLINVLFEYYITRMGNPVTSNMKQEVSNFYKFYGFEKKKFNGNLMSNFVTSYISESPNTDYIDYPPSDPRIINRLGPAMVMFLYTVGDKNNEIISTLIKKLEEERKKERKKERETNGPNMIPYVVSHIIDKSNKYELSRILQSSILQLLGNLNINKVDWTHLDDLIDAGLDENDKKYLDDLDELGNLD